MKKSIKWTYLALSFFVVTAFSVEKALAHPPAWEPAHGHHKKHKHKHKHHHHHDKVVVKETIVHKYHYYPQEQIYYQPERKKYFWLDGGRWRAGFELPTKITIGKSSPATIELDTDLPYTRHQYVKTKIKD